jgi:ABC-2 type transport system permease protein
MAPASAVFRRTLRDVRTATISFALLFGLVAVAVVTGYRHTYPDRAARVEFAAAFADNKAVRLFYGVPRDLVSTEGYAAWRLGGLVPLFAAAFGLIAATRVLRGEEDAGRDELVRAGAVSRPALLRARLAALACAVAALWLVELAALLASGLAPGGSALLAGGTALAALVYAAVGAAASQLLAPRRAALELASALLAADFFLRVVADTTGRTRLHWLAPLGWLEELRPFTGARPWVAALPLALAAGLVALAAGLSARRDVGAGILALRDVAPARTRLLSSPLAFALRSARTGLAVWVAGVALFAVVFGALAASVASAGLSERIREQLERLGGVDVATARGYLGLSFLFFVLAISLFACAQASAARAEEAGGRLETLLALPVARGRWLGGRLLLGAAGCVVLALVAGLAAGAGAAATGAGVSPARTLEAGLNCLPASLLFLGLAMLLTAVAPRATAAAYGIVVTAFVWELLGALLGSPSWLLALSPFHHVAPVPAVPFRATPALAMLAAGAAASALAVAWFRRRDLVAD